MIYQLALYYSYTLFITCGWLEKHTQTINCPHVPHILYMHTQERFGYDCNLSSLKREWTLHWFDPLGYTLHDMSWSTCEINPGLMGRQSGWCHESGNYKAFPNEAVTSLKSEQVTYRHEGDMAGDTMSVPSSGNRGYSRKRTFPFKGPPLRRFDPLGNVNITPP